MKYAINLYRSKRSVPIVVTFDGEIDGAREYVKKKIYWHEYEFGEVRSLATGDVLIEVLGREIKRATAAQLRLIRKANSTGSMPRKH